MSCFHSSSVNFHLFKWFFWRVVSLPWLEVVSETQALFVESTTSQLGQWHIPNTPFHCPALQCLVYIEDGGDGMRSQGKTDCDRSWQSSFHMIYTWLMGSFLIDKGKMMRFSLWLWILVSNFTIIRTSLCNDV